MPGQLPLELAHRPAFGREDFLVGASNARALAIVEAWPAWPSPVVLLAGPPGSGKSHLADIWRVRAAGAAVAARDLAERDVEPLVAIGAVVVEDLHAGPVEETALFHLLNGLRERDGHALLTSRVWPGAAGLALPDLVSRLKAAAPVEIGEPDDALLRQVLVKLFADRQLDVAPAAIDYVLRRMERSLDAARVLADRLDRRALAEGRAVTRSLAADVLADDPSVTL